MFVDDDSIINCNENESERNNEVENKLIDDSERGIENIDYINVRGSLCAQHPARITNNRTPPPCFSPHITTIKFHLILLHFKFCLANVHSCQYEQGTSAICFI